MRKLFIAALSVLCHASILSMTIQPFSSIVYAQEKGEPNPFLFKKTKLTLSAEVLNALNRENLGYLNFNGVGPDGRVFGSLAASFPVLPSVGIAIEF